MIREVKFESQDRRIKGIIEALNANGIKDIEEANAICAAAGLDPYKTCEETQPICFENAKWAYVVGVAIALKKGCKNAADAAEGAIKIAAKADKVRKEPLRCILNGLGKDAAQIISRINGFTYYSLLLPHFLYLYR